MEIASLDKGRRTLEAMEGIQADRMRAALSTVGRGSRGLLCFWNSDNPIILAGTTVAHAENKLHVLQLDREANEIHQCIALPVSAEAWSLAVSSQNSRENNIVVATRRGHKSAVEVWRLGGLADLSSSALELGSNSASGSDGHIEVTTTVSVTGQILKVCGNTFVTGSYLAVTQAGASVLDASNSFAVKATFPEGSAFETDGRPSKIVTGDWMDANIAFLLSKDKIGMFDTRSGNSSMAIDIKRSAESMKSEEHDEWISRNTARASSACSDGGNAIYVGGQDGLVRAFDIRKTEMLWEVRHERGQWVSALTSYGNGFLSGGTDGVVRSWTTDGKAVATFPQHDDTVTNICCSPTIFASVSYDGRIAINNVAPES